MTETAQTIKDVTETLAPYLDKLADSIGNNGAYVFQLMVKQAYVVGITDLISIVTSLLFITLSLVAGYKISNWGKKVGNNGYSFFDEHDDIAAWLYIIGVAVIIIDAGLIVRSFFILDEAIMCLANPEYQAIIQLLHAVK